MQSVLSPRGPAAAEIAELSSVLIAGGAAIFFLVIAALACAVWSRPPWLARERFVVAAGVVFPVVVLSILLLYVYRVGARLHEQPATQFRIEVTAGQWWWRVRYPGFETANEIRVPAGQPVELVLLSADVIHSFWVPNLAGKVDMIPGRANRLVITAMKEGVYRGQCAEFCGGPHALMALHVVAQSAHEFEIWKANQLQVAASDHALFNARCGACHSVRGTEAAGTRGPDLTHVASRLHLGAGTLANTPAAMSAWLADSQHVKPGSLMPAMRLGAAELESLAAYLSTLK